MFCELYISIIVQAVAQRVFFSLKSEAACAFILRFSGPLSATDQKVSVPAADAPERKTAISIASLYIQLTHIQLIQSFLLDRYVFVHIHTLESLDKFIPALIGDTILGKRCQMFFDRIVDIGTQ